LSRPPGSDGPAGIRHYSPPEGKPPGTSPPPVPLCASQPPRLLPSSGLHQAPKSTPSTTSFFEFQLSWPPVRCSKTLAKEAMWNRLILILTLGATAGIFVIPLNPVNSKILKLACLGCMIGTWIGLTILGWKRKPLRIAALILPFMGLIPFILPSGDIDPEELRQDYVRRMNEFEGTKYFWGGESSRGIDCSGLPRRAFRDALLAYGIKHFNGRAFRAYIEQWWFDASAKALGEGYRSYTSPIGTSGTIQKMDYTSLVPGDLAVTTSGVHILAYAGDGQWIQADPDIGAVATLDGRADDNGWFGTPVTTHRWQLLAPDKGTSEHDADDTPH